MRASSVSVVFCAVFAVALSATTADAATVRDQILSRALYFETSACRVLKVEFNAPTRYVSHYPFDHGTELRVELDALSISSDDARVERRREALDPPKGSDDVVASIVYEGGTIPRPRLAITFRQSVAFKLAQGGDFRSLIVAIAQPQGSGVCDPVFPETE
jgi:hypothetical protein